MQNRGPQYTAEILAIACPKCMVQPLERCVNKSGVIYPTQGHYARAVAAGVAAPRKLFGRTP